MLSQLEAMSTMAEVERDRVRKTQLFQQIEDEARLRGLLRISQRAEHLKNQN
jgi:hypothetical protein